MKRTWLCLILCCLVAMSGFAQKHTTFEMRYFSKDAKANGETDLHGDTETMSLEERVSALGKYAGYAARFWGDPQLNTPLFSDEDVRARLASIKEQPATGIRTTIRLDGWKAYGYKDGKESLQASRWKEWEDQGAVISNGKLNLEGVTVSSLPCRMNWRFRLKSTLSGKPEGLKIIFTNGDSPVISIDPGKYSRIAPSPESMEVYADLPDHRCFVTLDGKTVDEITLADVDTLVTGMKLDASTGRASFDCISLFSFVRDKDNAHTPYHSEMLINEDFEPVPAMSGWQQEAYDDSAWETVHLPSPLGGLQAEGESYYLRKKVKVGGFSHAELQLETLDPAGEVWINGEVAAVTQGRQPRSIDVTGFLVPDQENTIAVRVKPYRATLRSIHAPSDPNIGWFLGRAQLVLTGESHIDQVLVHTSSLEDGKAVQRHKITISKESVYYDKAKLEIRYYPWFPEEGGCAASVEREIELCPGIDNICDIDMEVGSPLLWSTGDPRLYKVEVILKDEKGNPIDDFVTTTGIRLIEQVKGTLYVNHKPEMLNGAQNFGFRGPVENISKHVRCATDEMVMRDLMMIQKMDANLLRIHVHAEKDKVEGINDPRFAEYADQMGIYLIWQTSGWIREGEASNVDFENYPAYMKQVYNHPSIVVWEASNHPNRFKKHGLNNSQDFLNTIIPTIEGTDTSRLISPTTFWQHTHLGNYDGSKDYQGNDITPNPLIRHKMLTRGSQDAYSGYGRTWTSLRNIPNSWAKSCLDAGELCYFNFEHEESAAQPNWELARKEPWYKVQSYEWSYEKGSIGRFLQDSEWRESQAYQAFSAWESMKRQTIEGVDGFSWCSLESGPNMFTYQKPLVDPFYVPKLAYHANRMVFQRMWAGSDDVDVVYGPADMVKPVIFNLGEGCTVNLTVELQNEKGKVLEKKTFKAVEVPAGRSVTRLEPFRFRSSGEGCRFIVYKIY